MHKDIIDPKIKPKFEIDEVVNNYRYVGLGDCYGPGNNRAHVFECLFCGRLFNCMNLAAYSLKTTGRSRQPKSRIGCRHNYIYSANIYPPIRSES